ncbi:MAG: biotin synthase BioB [Deltaproteobacteria bacterium]|nr:biotin synthase BioB [Deltaproteobacteria bacterium]
MIKSSNTTEKLSIAEAKTLKGIGLSSKEALELITETNSSIFSLLALTDKIRVAFKGTEINLCSIVNAKSGLCAEDCTFCGQSSKYDTSGEAYPMVASGEIVGAAKEAEKIGAREFSIVTSGTKVGAEKELETLSKAIGEINSSSGLESCASLGNVSKNTLSELKEAGLHSYHHNLETSRSFFPEICTTHDYEDDIDTIKNAKALGMYACSGGIFGLGESWDDRAELAMTLKDLDVDCVPINFLDPRPGTPLEDAKHLSPKDCLKIIALFRLILPKKDIIVCGGREVNLRDQQALIFSAGANGMMIGNYLTTKGRASEDDLQMLEDLGLTPRK